MNNKAFFFYLSFALMVSLFLAVGSQVQAQQLGLNEHFDDPDLTGWEYSAGVVVEDGLLILEPNQYALVYGPWAEGAYLARMLWDGPGAVVIHYLTNDTGSYLLRLEAGAVLFLRDQKGELTELASAPIPDLQGTWLDLVLLVTGGNFSVALNGDPVLETEAASSLTPGGVLLRSEGDTVVKVDYLMIEAGGPGAGEEVMPAADATAESPPGENLQAGERTNPAELQWQRLGGPPGGLGYDIRYQFDDPAIWYSTDDGGGVHISRDNGYTWEQQNTGIQAASGPAGDGIPVFTLSVDPLNPETIWIGTTSGQIYRSDDGGSTWTEKDQGIIRQPEVLIKFRGLTIDPLSSDIVYVMGELIGTPTEPGQIVTGGVVYKTIDGGENWDLIWGGTIPSSLTRYLWVNPSDTDILYVSTGIFDAAAVGDQDPATSADPFGGLGILKSTDGGKTWKILGKENGLASLTVGSLFMHPEDPDVLLAATGRLIPEYAGQVIQENNHNDAGIYRTNDGGETWSKVLDPKGESLLEIFTAVEICPSDPDIAYAAGGGVYRSEDAGLTWDRVTIGYQGWGPPGIGAGIPIDLQCDPRNPDRLFANNYQGGNFFSEDGGITWINASTGYSGAQMIGVAVDPFDPARVFATGRSGAWISLDGGDTWDGIHNPGDVASLGVECGSVGVDPGQPDHVIFTCLSGFFALDPDTQLWSRYPDPQGIHPGTSEIEFAPSDPDVVYITSASHNTMIHGEGYEDGWGILSSRDGGQTWQAITGELFLDQILTDVAVDPTNANVLYVAAEKGLYKSEDGGLSWEAPSHELKDLPVRTVGIDPNNPDQVLVGVQLQGLFLSQDGGVSFKQVTSGLEPNGSHRDIVFDPTIPDTVYTADILSGVYRSIDGGLTWEKLNQGLTNRAVTSLSLSADGKHLYAATSGGGVFRLDLFGQPPVGSAEAQEAGQPGGVVGESGEPDPMEDPPGLLKKAGSSLPYLGGLAVLVLVGILIASRRSRSR